MNLNSRDRGAEDRTKPLRIELLPGRRMPPRLVQKLFLANATYPTTLYGVQHGDWVGEPRANPACDQPLDLRGRKALPLPLRFNALSQQRFGDVVAIAN